MVLRTYLVLLMVKEWKQVSRVTVPPAESSYSISA